MMDRASSTDRRQRRRILLLGGAIVLAMVGAFVAILLRSRPPAGGSVATVEAWLNDNGFDVFRPFRDNVPPGTLLRLEKRGQSVAVPLSETALPASDPAHAAGVSWQVDTKLDALAEASIVPGLQVARLHELGAARVVVSIDDVTIREIPLVKLADSVKSNSVLIRATKARDPSLVLVGSVIEAGKIQAEFFTSDNAKPAAGRGLTIASAESYVTSVV